MKEPSINNQAPEKHQAPSAKPWGFDVVVEFRGPEGFVTKTLHKQGSETAVRRWAMLKPHAVRVVSVSPYTREQWIRVWGDGRVRL